MLPRWEELPKYMQNKEVKAYYDLLVVRKKSLILKRIFDVVAALILLVLLLPVFLVLVIAIKIDSPGPIFFRQVRITQCGREFKIFKFRTMVVDAEKLGTQVTVKDDIRITRVGKIIRKYRLDEICQLIDILRGTMSFVGTRPEVPKYVQQYTPEMLATLLLPAGVTSKASIYYRDEDEILASASDADRTYIEEILPQKMRYNLEAIKEFSILQEIKIMLKTVFAVMGKNYKKC